MDANCANLDFNARFILCEHPDEALIASCLLAIAVNVLVVWLDWRG